MRRPWLPRSDGLRRFCKSVTSAFFFTGHANEAMSIMAGCTCAVRSGLEAGSTVEELVYQAKVHPLRADIFRDDDESIRLCRHQEEAS